jgi:hypothetical protein
MNRAPLPSPKLSKAAPFFDECLTVEVHNGRTDGAKMVAKESPGMPEHVGA